MDGWIDLQINGYAGIDFNSPGLSPEAVKAVCDLRLCHHDEGCIADLIGKLATPDSQ
jgi:N-acetylglucosamine-6-phosphate deacetylase